MRSAVFVLGLASIAAALPIAQREAAITCVSGIYMIVARGSNEDPGEGRLSQVTSLVKSLIPGSASVAVDYPATIFDDGTYPVSVYEGIDDAIAKIEAYVSACGSASRIALLGYSQGGNVMTDALAGGVLKPDPIPAQYKKNSMLAPFRSKSISSSQICSSPSRCFNRRPDLHHGSKFRPGNRCEERHILAGR